MSDADTSSPPSGLPVAWDAEGTPYSPRFGDRYRSAGLDRLGGLAQARHVFLAGCALAGSDGQPLPQAAWRGATVWRVLENGLGLGLNFLATWQAWRQDAQRPATLIYEATEAWPPTADDVRRSAAPFTGLDPFANALAEGWPALLRHGALSLDQGHVQLRLYGGDAQQSLQGLAPGVDTVFLDGFDPRCNPAMWSPGILQAIGQLASPGARAATWCVSRAVRDGLASAGFTVTRRDGLPPKRHCLAAVKTPASALRA